MKLKELVFKKLKKLTKTKFDENSNIFEIGIDSLDLVELVTEIEDELDISVSDDELANIKTVNDVIKSLKNK